MTPQLTPEEQEVMREFDEKFVRKDDYQTGIDRIDGFCNPDDIKTFLLTAIQDVERRTKHDTTKRIIELIDKIEMNNKNDTLEEWKEYKHIRNSIRDQVYDPYRKESDYEER